MEKNEIIVNSEMEGMRLDRYLRKSFKNEPLSRIFGAIRSGDVKINGKKSKENYRLLLDDKITIKNLSMGNIKKNEKIENKIKKLQISQNDLEKYKKMVIFENEDFFIVNKAEKIPMHKGTGHKYGLSEVFKKIYKSENINFANRIDFETSGLVIGCKTLKFLRYISEKIRENEVHKKYFAIVHNRKFKKKNEFLENNFEENKKDFKIENYLTTTENRVIVSENPVSRESKKSITYFKYINIDKLKNQKKILDLLGKNKDVSLLDIELITGRKHQIRAQLADKGLFIVGDKKYGIKDGSDRFFLCCYFLSFDEYKFSILDRVFF
ncbi:MAG: RluA family pseudouridine synthase [Leptotrichia wadei]|uniref:RluA family pseudouridine synthase n=2 Tax=Leptotrichia TaxID=32067 RepID=UPI0026ECA0A9|nr:RluA family pseudouridine synthase [Leptotrichia wadei]MBS6019456.1 RluA family pseudouridine synthase [Leptotrichia wadei]